LLRSFKLRDKYGWIEDQNGPVLMNRPILQHNHAGKLKEVVQGDVFTLRDALLAFREKFEPKASAKKLVAACLCVGISGFLFASLSVAVLNDYIDVFRPLNGKKKNNVPYQSLLTVAKEWSFRVNGFPANTNDVFGPDFNCQAVKMSLWKDLEKEIDNGRLEMVQWTAGCFIS